MALFKHVLLTFLIARRISMSSRAFVMCVIGIIFAVATSAYSVAVDCDFRCKQLQYINVTDGGCVYFKEGHCVGDKMYVDGGIVADCREHMDGRATERWSCMDGCVAICDATPGTIFREGSRANLEGCFRQTDVKKKWCRSSNYY